MPIIAYYSVKIKDIVTKDKKSGKITSREKNIPHYQRLKVKVKDIAEAMEISKRKDFVRYACGPWEIQDLIARKMKEGKADWYV